jgi:glucose/arabinose dehydrogenase
MHRSHFASPSVRQRCRANRRLLLEPLEHRALLATLPAGFTETAIAAGLSSATAMEIAPNGDVWVLQQGGVVKRFVAGSTTADVIGNVSTLGLSASGERGLLGIAFDPNYSTTKQVYLYYTATTPIVHNRISRFTVVDTEAADYYFAGTDTTPADAGSTGTPTQSIMFELDALSSATNHNGGAIHFGPDGKLYAAVGDNANGANAQSLANLHGKMLRINKDGTIPTDNPFFTTAMGDERAIWALGLRNPFTFTFQPGTGLMFINDVGQNTWEEIDEGIAGSNYGWPENEGFGTNPTAGPGTDRQPLYAYSHGSGPFQGFAITGGAFYNPVTPQFPSSYDGDYFFADFVSDWINVRDNSTGEVSQFATGALGAVDLHVTSDGSLLYLARDANQVFRVQSTASQAPNITQEPASATVSAGATATFTVAATGTPPLAYQWQKLVGATWTNLANGGRISGATSATLSIANSQSSDGGDYRVIVSNTSGTDTSSTATLTVTANQAPSASITINSGLTGGKFIAGQGISFSATASDPEDGSLAASQFTWQIDYITSIDSGTPVVRPFVPEFSGQTSGSFTPATTGPYTLTDVAYRITLTVHDSGGLPFTTALDVLPNVSTLTVTASPAGLQVTVDGQPFPAPHTFASVVGFQRPIGAPASQSSSGTTYNFSGWSDGGAATHTISTPLANTTYTATYVAAPAAFTARVDFQTSNSQGFAGYVADTGQVFGNRGNGFSYGWNASNSSTTRNRNASNSPDERYDTLIHLQKSPNSNARWEIAVPNGTYNVRLVAGDPKFFDSVYRINVEGVLGLAGTPTTSQRWIDSTVQVTVSDGRLTVSNAVGAQNNKLAFLEVTQVASASVSQPPPAPSGLVASYAFNEGAGTTTADSSASGNAGTLSGGASFIAGRSGAGTAVSLNGAGAFVGLRQDLSRWLGGTGTAAFWLRTTQVGNNTAWLAPGVLGVESAGNGNDVFWGWLDAVGRIGIQAGNTPGAKSAGPVNDGRWHHIALTRDAASGAVQVYVDGVRSGSARSDAGVKTTAFRSLGRIEDTGGTPTYLTGALDDVRLYGRVLMRTEIQGLLS